MRSSQRGLTYIVSELEHVILKWWQDVHRGIRDSDRESLEQAV